MVYLLTYSYNRLEISVVAVSFCACHVHHHWDELIFSPMVGERGHLFCANFFWELYQCVPFTCLSVWIVDLLPNRRTDRATQGRSMSFEQTISGLLLGFKDSLYHSYAWLMNIAWKFCVCVCMHVHVRVWGMWCACMCACRLEIVKF